MHLTHNSIGRKCRCGPGQQVQFKLLSHPHGPLDKTVQGIALLQGQEVHGSTDKWASGNGGLMRLHPVVITARSEEEAVKNAVYQTSLTHNNQEVLMYSEAYAREL